MTIQGIISASCTKTSNQSFISAFSVWSQSGTNMSALACFVDKSGKKWKAEKQTELFLRGKTGQRLWERGGMFNKSWKENFHKIYLAVAQKPLLLIQVCESSIELRNIKSLNVRTLMFQLGGGTTTGGTTAQGGILRSFHPRL